MSEVKHGWYSTKAALRVGTVRYKTPAGKVVTLTCVSSSHEKPSTYWGDEVYIGPVTDFASSHPVTLWDRLE
mgnify:FL=1